MTWLWREKSAAWLQLNNAAFGIGALAAPVLVSWDLDRSGSFHNAYYIIGGINIAVAIVPLLIPTPVPPEQQQEQSDAVEKLASEPQDGGQDDDLDSKTDAIGVVVERNQALAREYSMPHMQDP